MKDPTGGSTPRDMPRIFPLQEGLRPMRETVNCKGAVARSERFGFCAASAQYKVVTATIRGRVVHFVTELLDSFRSVRLHI